ncbi:MAG: hypothetical protein ACYC3F_16675 [Gemmatimonadaceae bacterium]
MAVTFQIPEGADMRGAYLQFELKHQINPEKQKRAAFTYWILKHVFRNLGIMTPYLAQEIMRFGFLTPKEAADRYCPNLFKSFLELKIQLRGDNDTVSNYHPDLAREIWAQSLDQPGINSERIQRSGRRRAKKERKEKQKQNHEWARK